MFLAQPRSKWLWVMKNTTCCSTHSAHYFSNYIFSLLCKNLLCIYIYIYILMKLPWLENSANTSMQHIEHWTAVSTLLGLISSAYRDLHHRRSNQQPQNAETETLPLGHQSMPHISNSKSTSHIYIICRSFTMVSHRYQIWFTLLSFVWVLLTQKLRQKS